MAKEIKTRLEELTKTRENLIGELERLMKEYQTGTANLNALDGAILVLKEFTSETPTEEVVEIKSEEIKES